MSVVEIAAAAPQASRLRVLHVITGLATGGAETMLLKLLRNLDRDAFHVEVVSLMDEGTIGPKLIEAGIRVHSLGLRQGRGSVGALWKLRRLVRDFGPDVIQGWMYHGNLAASLAAALGRRRVPVIWNIRQTVYRLGDNSRMTATLIRLGARLSGRARAIVYNSHASAVQHAQLGYSERDTVLIPNGFDCDTFRPDPASPAALRRRIGVPPSTRLVGMIARYHAMKDFPTALHAAQLLRAQDVNVSFLLAGRGVAPDNHALSTLVRERSLTSAVHLLGEVADVAGLVAGLDVVCSASAWGEGFPNVLGEAMASGVPCVTTDVGDSADVVGDAGVVVPPRDPAALAAAIRSVLDLPEDERSRLSFAARERICTRFALAHIARCYETLYRRIAGAPLEGSP